MDNSVIMVHLGADLYPLKYQPVCYAAAACNAGERVCFIGTQGKIVGGDAFKGQRIRRHKPKTIIEARLLIQNYIHLYSHARI